MASMKTSVYVIYHIIQTIFFGLTEYEQLPIKMIKPWFF